MSRRPCSRGQGTAPVARLAMTESFACDDSADVRDSHDHADTADSEENSDRTEPKEPTEPIDRNDPADPMESVESVEAIERSELREARESREVMRTVCAHDLPPTTGGLDTRPRGRYSTSGVTLIE